FLEIAQLFDEAPKLVDGIGVKLEFDGQIVIHSFPVFRIAGFGDSNRKIRRSAAGEFARIKQFGIASRQTEGAGSHQDGQGKTTIHTRWTNLRDVYSRVAWQMAAARASEASSDSTA